MSSLLAFSRLDCFRSIWKWRALVSLSWKIFQWMLYQFLQVSLCIIFSICKYAFAILASPVEERRFDEDKDILSVKFDTPGSVHCTYQVRGDDCWMAKRHANHLRDSVFSFSLRLVCLPLLPPSFSSPFLRLFLAALLPFFLSLSSSSFPFLSLSTHISYIAETRAVARLATGGWLSYHLAWIFGVI